MKVKEIRELSEMELDKKLVELKQELFNLRFQLAVNKLDNPTRIGAVKNPVHSQDQVQRRQLLRFSELPAIL